MAPINSEVLVYNSTLYKFDKNLNRNTGSAAAHLARSSVYDYHRNRLWIEESNTKKVKSYIVENESITLEYIYDLPNYGGIKSLAIDEKTGCCYHASMGSSTFYVSKIDPDTTEIIVRNCNKQSTGSSIFCSIEFCPDTDEVYVLHSYS